MSEEHLSNLLVSFRLRKREKVMGPALAQTQFWVLVIVVEHRSSNDSPLMEAIF